MAWAIQWRSENKLDGIVRRLQYDRAEGDTGVPVLFRTRSLARKYISSKYGYIKHRKDLRAEPHGWRLPVPVKVSVTVQAALPQEASNE